MTVQNLEKLSKPKIDALLEESPTVLIPIGSLEQHGFHLPIGTDTMVAVEIARRVGEKRRLMVAPPIFYTPSQLEGMKATFTVRPQSLSAYVADICRSFASQGFKRIIFINGHGGNLAAFDSVGMELSRETGSLIVRIDWWIMAQKRIAEILETPLMHACEGETSLVLSIDPSTVDMTQASADMAYWDFVSGVTRGEFNLPEMYIPFGKLAKKGVVGDPTKASAKKGEEILEAVVADILALFDRLEKVNQL